MDVLTLAILAFDVMNFFPHLPFVFPFCTWIYSLRFLFAACLHARACLPPAIRHTEASLARAASPTSNLMPLELSAARLRTCSLLIVVSCIIEAAKLKLESPEQEHKDESDLIYASLTQFKHVKSI
jgi:hypothetical protein